ncbi:hypothetical protein OG762_42645 [Streptomyces sp. NBC_01136]|uniref:hypothetical protein n=1 Tax=unclassified Streptomyces TaxID=2593676 RepID=UPI0032507B68|nr:hypothetical protein OG762_42645 [Streptomyces sp. NBC_01136]
MLKSLKRVLTVAGVSSAAVALAATSAFASGVNYPSQSKNVSYGNCTVTVSGHSSYSSTYGGYVFIGDSSANSIYCSEAYVEVVWIDKSGNEQYKKVYSYGGATETANAVYKLLPSQYSKVLEVVGYGINGTHSTPTAYLYF